MKISAGEGEPRPRCNDDGGIAMYIDDSGMLHGEMTVGCGIPLPLLPLNSVVDISSMNNCQGK